MGDNVMQPMLLFLHYLSSLYVLSCYIDEGPSFQRPTLEGGQSGSSIFLLDRGLDFLSLILPYTSVDPVSRMAPRIFPLFPRCQHPPGEAKHVTAVAMTIECFSDYVLCYCFIRGCVMLADKTRGRMGVEHVLAK